MLAIVRGGLLVAFPDQGCRKTVVGLVSVVKVAEAYSRHGDEREGLSRAIRRVAGPSELADGCGDSDSRIGECVRGPMGHRAAMRGRRRRRCRGGMGATAAAEECWVVWWDDETGDWCEYSSATTAIVGGQRERERKNECRTERYSLAGQCSAAQDEREREMDIWEAGLSG